MGNPKRVVRAFIPAATTAAGLTLLPFTAGTILLLEKIEHPIVDDAAKREMTNEEILSLVFILTRPVKESNALLNQGPEAFSDAVMEFAGTIPVGELRPLGQAIREHFKAALETAAHAGDAPGKKEAPAAPA
jgi:hypothetical protein